MMCVNCCRFEVIFLAMYTFISAFPLQLLPLNKLLYEKAYIFHKVNIFLSFQFGLGRCLSYTC